MPPAQNYRRFRALLPIGIIVLFAFNAQLWAGLIQGNPPSTRPGFHGRPQGIVNAAAYGIFSGGSTTHPSATCTAGSRAVTLGSAGDFQNGQGVALLYCGPSPAVSTPGAPTISPTCTSSCSTTWNYEIVAVDANHGLSAAGPAGASVTNASTLTVDNHNLITWNAVSGAVAYVIYRQKSRRGSFALLTYTQVPKYDDFGQPSVTPGGSIPATAPATPIDGNLTSYILSGAGTTRLLLHDAAVNSSTATWLQHNDAPIVQLAVNGLATQHGNSPGGGTIWLPPGNYTWASPLTVNNGTGVMVIGAGRWATEINPAVELAGLSAFRFVNSRESGIADLWINGAQVTGAIPGAGVEFNEDHPIGPASTHDQIRQVAIGNTNAGSSLVNGVVFSYVNDANNEDSDIEDVFMQDLAGCGVVIGHSNSEGHRFRHLGVGYAPCGIQAWSGGFTDVQGFYNIAHYPHGVIYDYEPGIMYHSSQSIGMFTESSAQLLRSSAGLSNLVFNFIGIDDSGGERNEDLINLSSSSSSLSITGSWIQTGQPGTSIYSADPRNTVQLVNNTGLGLSEINANSGTVVSLGNNWLQPPAFVAGAQHLVEVGDYSASASAVVGTPPTVTGSPSSGSTTVGALPSCGSSLIGAWSKVTDSTTVGSEGQACVGGGTTQASALCTSNGWRCF